MEAGAGSRARGHLQTDGVVLGGAGGATWNRAYLADGAADWLRSMEIRRGFQERALYMIDIAEEELADIALPPKDNFRRFIRRDPIGLVLASSCRGTILIYVRSTR